MYHILKKLIQPFPLKQHFNQCHSLDLVGSLAKLLTRGVGFNKLIKTLIDST